MNQIYISPVAVVFAFCSLNEAITEYFFGNVEKIHPYIPLISLLTAIFLSFAYQVNIFSLILGVQSNSPFLDFLLSGFLISRGSNFINDFAQRVLRSK